MIELLSCHVIREHKLSLKLNQLSMSYDFILAEPIREYTDAMACLFEALSQPKHRNHVGHLTIGNHAYLEGSRLIDSDLKRLSRQVRLDWANPLI